MISSRARGPGGSNGQCLDCERPALFGSAADVAPVWNPAVRSSDCNGPHYDAQEDLAGRRGGLCRHLFGAIFATTRVVQCKAGLRVMKT